MHNPVEQHVEPEICAKPAEAPVTIFSAPRRFDLATMLSVTTAYALLFALMRALGSSDMFLLYVGTAVTLVACGQAILFGGKSPRASSMLIGAGIASATMFVAFSRLTVAAVIQSMIIGSLWGIPLGYLVGTIIGGVFLIAHAVRQRFGQ